MDVRDPSHRPRVLLVDDSAANRELLRSILEGEADIVEAADGHRALELGAAPEIDLILLDVMMPGLTGYEVSRRLRVLRAGDYLPILLLTSLTETAEKVAGFEAGADDFISKPLDTHELRLRVRAFLRTRRLHLERQALLEDLHRLHDLKDDLVALLVHDLRNPLSGLMAHLHLLVAEPMTADAKESIESARVATNRLRDLIDDLLRVRLLEDGALEVKREPRDLADVVKEALQTMAGAAKEQRITLVHEAAVPVPVACEATLVRRAVENLLANAIKHGGTGTTVVVQTTTSGTNGVISVQDAGPGISVEERPLLFTKYGNTSLRRAGRRSGHGLGLYLVSLVMREHEGSVFVDDSIGQGTRVVMTLPRYPTSGEVQ